MTNAVLVKRIEALENQVRTLRSLVKHRGFSPTTRLPRGVETALRQVAKGKMSRPFATVEELMAHLGKK